MTSFHYSPLEVNPQTGEFFLRLRKHKNIIITPPRKEDVDGYIRCLNDERVYDGLASTPFPFLLEHAEAWSKRVIDRSNAIIAELTVAEGASTPALVSGCPVRHLREVKEDGTDVYLGDIQVGRIRDTSLLVLPKRDDATKAEKEEALKKNDGLPLGDEVILFTIGGEYITFTLLTAPAHRASSSDYLAPSHHGQGIMTDAIDTLLWEWAIPRMGVRKIRTSAFEGNPGSVRVFEKNGFTLTQTLDNYMETRGKMRNLHVLEWEHGHHT